MPDCSEACAQLGPWGPILVTLLGLALGWVRERAKRKAAEQDAKGKAAEAETHKAVAQELRVRVASLSPPPMSPVVVPVAIPPLGKPIASDDPPEGDAT